MSASKPEEKSKEALQAEIKRLQALVDAKNKTDAASQQQPPQQQSAIATTTDSKESAEADQILIVVANRLPVSMQYVDNKWKFKPSAGGLVTALKQLGNLDMEWVGCPGFIEPSQREVIENKLNTFNVHPVFVEKRDYDNYYNGFCNGILWPLFHYIELNDEIVVPNFKKLYESYSRINLLFAKAIDQLIEKLEAEWKRKGSKKKQILIWIHDYHLMLCPNYIRRMSKSRRDAMIGFFLHIPFPTWEQFRILPKANDLLQGVLACNLIGFHIHDYSQHFRGACAHILQCELAPDAIIHQGRMTIVSTHPIGTDINKWREGLKQQEIQNLIAKYQQIHHDKKIILGVDRLDFIKGIPHKLYAFSKFLENNPNLRDKVVYIQIAVPTRQTAEDYVKLTKKCNELVGKINSKYASFSSVPIHFLYQSFGFNDLVAFYNIASVCYVTSLRDGMNLVSYEYISCQHEEDPGVLIVSEFAGSAQSLGCGSIVVNPWDVEDVSTALKTALTMTLEQRQTHQEILSKIISKNTVQHWANTFINALEISYRECPQNAPIVPSPLNLNSVQRIFKSSPFSVKQNRVIILGLGGTMIPSISKHSNLNLSQYTGMKKISAKIVESINKISLKENCTVAILSSLPRKCIENLLKDVYCIQYAENGYFMRDNRINNKNKSKGIWQRTTTYTDNSWKDEVLKIMRYFKERTPNTTLDDLNSFVSFRYSVSNKITSLPSSASPPPTSKASAFSTTTNTRNNISQLVTSLQTGPLQSSYARLVHDTAHGHIQVRQPGVSKLSSITRLIQKVAADKPIDYILCVANFLSFDEEVFVYLNGLQEEYNTDDAATTSDEYTADEDSLAKSSLSSIPRIGSSSGLAKMYQLGSNELANTDRLSKTAPLLSANCIVDTIKVGRYATRAKHYLMDNKRVETLLYKLSQIVAKEDDNTDYSSSSPTSGGSPTGLTSSTRNWSVNSDLSKLDKIMSPLKDEDEFKISVDYSDVTRGGDKLFASVHYSPIETGNDTVSGIPTTGPPTGLASIPPTAPNNDTGNALFDENDTDYASFGDDDDTIQQQAEKTRKSQESLQADKHSEETKNQPQSSKHQKQKSQTVDVD